MHIWIEPQTWEGDQKPLVQLDVKITNFLDMEKVSGSEAVGSPHRKCTCLALPARRRNVLKPAVFCRDGLLLNHQVVAFAR